MKSSVLRIVLYGSVASGTATEESDIDIAIPVKGGHRVTENLSVEIFQIFPRIDLGYDDG